MPKRESFKKLFFDIYVKACNFCVTLCAQIDPILSTFIAQTFQHLLVGKNGETGAPAQSLAAEERRPGREVAIMQRGLNRADDEDDGDYEDDGYDQDDQDDMDDGDDGDVDINCEDSNDGKVDDARVCIGSSASTEREVCATKPCPG